MIFIKLFSSRFLRKGFNWTLCAPRAACKHNNIFYLRIRWPRPFCSSRGTITALHCLYFEFILYPSIVFFYFFSSLCFKLLERAICCNNITFLCQVNKIIILIIICFFPIRIIIISILCGWCGEARLKAGVYVPNRRRGS